MRNHIGIPGARRAPEAILRALRAIDPLYDIHYLGDGRWAVGRVVPSSSRRTIGMKMKHNIMRNPNLKKQQQRLRIAELAIEGFGVVAIYKFLGEPTDELVQDVRQRHYNYQVDRERFFREALDEAEVHKGVTGEMLDEIEYRERHVTPELFRGKKHFPQGASNEPM
jgi:hypothetical protein